MTESKDNVVPFNANKQDVAQDPATKDLPNPIQQQMKYYDELIEKLTIDLDETLIGPAIPTNEKLDITLPLQALMTSFSRTALGLDAPLTKEQYQLHQQLRVDLSNAIHKSITTFMKESGAQVYQQDIYLALSYITISYLHQQRAFTFSSDKQEERRGQHDEQDQAQDQPVANHDQSTDPTTI